MSWLHFIAFVYAVHNPPSRTSLVKKKKSDNRLP